jgi:hypothetical protein
MQINSSSTPADDSDTLSEDIGRRLARRKAAVKHTDQPSDLTKPTMVTAHIMTVGQPAVLPAGSLATVGPPAGAAVGLDEGLVVGETVVCLDKGIAVRELVVGLDKELVMGETVVGLDESLVVGRRLARRKAANKPTDQPSDLSANKPTNQPSDLSANKPTDDRDMSMYVFDQGRGDSDEEVAQGGPSNEPRNEPINLEEQFFIDQHNNLCEVCNQPSCCAVKNAILSSTCPALDCRWSRKFFCALTARQMIIQLKGNHRNTSSNDLGG